MANKYSTIKQHEPLRVPAGWTGEKRRLIAQLEEIFDDIYKRFGRLGVDDLSGALRKTIASVVKSSDENSENISEIIESVATLELTSEQFSAELQKKVEKTYVDSAVTSLTESIGRLELTSEEFEVELQKKAEKTYVDSSLEGKVDQTEYNGQITQITENIAALELTSEQFSVELSEKVSQKDVDESIENIDEFHNTAVSITARGMEMNTTGSIKAIVDGDEELTIDEDGVSAKRLVARDEIYAPNLSMKYLSNVIPWKGAIQTSLDAIPKHLTQDARLTVPAGTYQENVTIQGFCGAGIEILFEPGVTLIGTVTVNDCSRVSVYANSLGDAKIYPQSAESTITADSVTQLILRNLYISGYRGRTTAQDGSECAVSVNSSACMIYGCGLEYAKYGVQYAHGAMGYVDSALGGQMGTSPTVNTNLIYGVYAKAGAHVAAFNTIPMGGEAAAGKTVSTLVLDENIIPTAGGMDYTAPSEITKTFAISKNVTYRLNKSMREGLLQGVYGPYELKGWATAAMWFEDAMEALAGQNILSAQLKLHRSTGGSSAPVNVYLGTAAVTQPEYDATLWPEFTPSASNYPGERIARESEMTYDVTELMDAVKQGYALALHEPIEAYDGDWSPAYTYFYAMGTEFEPVLTVTYGSNEQPDADIAFTQNDDGSVTLTNTTFTKLDDSTVQMDNATFTQQDDGSVLVQ